MPPAMIKSTLLAKLFRKASAKICFLTLSLGLIGGGGGIFGAGPAPPPQKPARKSLGSSSITNNLW